jgi:tetratricopeptide (TPR) repeat protein
MRDVAKRLPDDADAGTLFAEAMMDLRPWDFWTKDGKPEPGTEEIVSTLEGVLKKHPEHPGANHYYIHAVEASSNPGRALASADRFDKGLVPGAGHLVHMPAHIYMRTGRYDGAVEANVRAAAVDEAYIKRANPQGIYPLMYYGHNLQFLCGAAGMDGRSAAAVKAGQDLIKALPADAVREMPMMEFVLTLQTFALARFGKWDEILALAPPPAEQRYTTTIWRYGRALAFDAKGAFDDADREQTAFDAAAATVPPDIVFVLNTSGSLVKLAGVSLAGELAARRGKTDEAIAKLKEAVALEDALHYDEPPAWYAPVRHSLGAVLLAAGKVAEAEMVYREDLKINPENGWSLFGLSQCLRARSAGPELADVEKRFRKAWARADVTLTSSRF